MTRKSTFFLTGCLLVLGTGALAQETKPALVSTPEPAATEATVLSSPDNHAASEPGASTTPARVNYSLEMGAMAGTGRFGYTATYLRPTAYYNVNNRFRLFTGLTYLNLNGAGRFSESGGSQPFNSAHYLLEAGGQYQYSDNLMLTGSVWKDFSQAAGPAQNLYAPGRQGMSFRADYKVTDRMTITGGFRYSNGLNANPHNRHFGQPFGPAGF